MRFWAERHPHRRIEEELNGDVLELSGLSSEGQRRLAGARLPRQTRR